MFGLIKLSNDEKVIIAQALAFSYYTFSRRGNNRQAQQQLRANAKIAQKLGIDIPTLKQGESNNAYRAYRCAMSRYVPANENTETQEESEQADQ